MKRISSTTPRWGAASPGRRRNPRGQGERLREEILQAADSAITASGDARQLSLRGVARRVGIATTSVYLHFPDVDHLKMALVERGFVDLNAARDAASEGIVDPVESLRARLRAYAHWGLKHPGPYRLMFGPELPPALAFDAERSPGREAFRTLVNGIERCQQAGLSGHDDDTFHIAGLIWTAIHGQVILRLDRPRFPWPPLDDMVDETVSRLLGVRTT